MEYLSQSSSASRIMQSQTWEYLARNKIVRRKVQMAVRLAPVTIENFRVERSTNLSGSPAMKTFCSRPALFKCPSLHIHNQAKNARRLGSLNPYCVVLVGGLEVGRTTKITDSFEPLWATDFHLPDDLLLGPSSLSRSSRNVGDDLETEITPPQLSPAAVALEVWDSVSEGNPVLLGAAEVPSGVLQKVLASSLRGEGDGKPNVRTKQEGGDEDKRRGCQGSNGTGSSDLVLLNLNLRLRHKGKQHKHPQLTGTVGGKNSSTAAIVAAKSTDHAIAGAERDGGEGVLSCSLKRIVSCADKENNDKGQPRATAEDEPLPARLSENSGNVTGLGKEVMEMRTTEASTYVRLLLCVVLGHRRIHHKVAFLPA